MVDMAPFADFASATIFQPLACRNAASRQPLASRLRLSNFRLHLLGYRAEPPVPFARAAEVIDDNFHAAYAPVPSACFAAQTGASAGDDGNARRLILLAHGESFINLNGLTKAMRKFRAR